MLIIIDYHFSLSEAKIIQKLILLSWYRNPAQFGDTPPHRDEDQEKEIEQNCTMASGYGGQI